MSGLFGSLGVGRSALFANQLVLQTTANNVANAGRAGYSRQRVDLAASFPENLPVGQLGTGVSVEGVRRLRDRFLDQQYLHAEQSRSQREADLATLQQVETLFGEPSDSGLRSSLSTFFSALQDLSTYPQDATTRRAALEQADIVAGDLRRLRAGLDDLTRNIETTLAGRVNEVNGLLGEIAEYNDRIHALAVGGSSANDLMDGRDLSLDKLAALVGIVRTDRGDGMVGVTLAGGGGVLVEGTAASELGVVFDGTADAYRLSLEGTQVSPTGGEIAGLLQARNDPDGTLKFTKSRLDALAGGLIEQVNRIQASGSGSLALARAVGQSAVTDPAIPLGSAGLPFSVTPGSFQIFVYDAASQAVTAAGTITLTAATSLDDLAGQLNGVAGLTAGVTGGTLEISAAAGSQFRFAADDTNSLVALGLNPFFTGSNAGSIAVNPALLADPRLLTTGWPDPSTGQVAAGDNRAALALADLGTAKVLEGGTASLVDTYAEMIGTLGARTAAADRAATSEALVVQAISTQRERVSGVSLDEEMTTMIETQRAFQASARVVQVVDELLNTLINGMLS
jgi:flagellar hook-associated protein 1